ncbi:hypothetical protein GF325_02020 [Candidatus Bathyarchaeota archaeon]|nr:hypothetical protein [Candidatus Bathyarchaeota archaeon]
MSGNTRNIDLICPVCNTKQSIQLPVDLIANNIKGVSTIAINAQCGHSFHIFVDKNFAVRGYQRSDFDIQLDTAGTVEREPIQDLSLSAVVRMFGEDAFVHAMHSMLLGQKCVLYGSDQQILKSLFINFIEIFEREIGDSADALEIMSKDEYESINPVMYSNDLVIDLDFSVVKVDPFNDKLKLERDLLKECLDVKDVEAQKNLFKEKIAKIFLYANVILNFINMGTTNFKDIKKAMKQTNKNIPQKDLQLSYEIAQHRYKKYLK